MYSNRKLKSSFFLRDNSYPERILSKHRHYKKSGMYAKYRSLFAPVSSSSKIGTLSRSIKNSKMLLEGIPHLYSGSFLKGELNIWDRSVKALPLAKSAQVDDQAVTTLAGELQTPTYDKTAFSQGEDVSDKRSVAMISRTAGFSSQEREIGTNVRGLQEMESCGFTNGLLGSGHRYFYVL